MPAAARAKPKADVKFQAVEFLLQFILNSGYSNEDKAMAMENLKRLTTPPGRMPC